MKGGVAGRPVCRGLVLGLGIACASVILPAPVQAQAPRRHGPAPQNVQYYSEPLRTPLHLAYLPEPGAGAVKFESGLHYPRLKAGRCYLMRYFAREKSSGVIDWWLQALSHEGWQIDSRQTTPSSITAARKRNGLYVTVYVLPGQRAGYRSYFEVKYLSTGEPLTAEPR